MGLYFEEFTPGTRFETPGRTITEADIIHFAGLTGDFNPLHVDELFAQKSEFGGRIAHGPMAIGMAFGLAARIDLLDGTVLALLAVAWQFKAPIRAGDTVHARIQVGRTRPSHKPDRGTVDLVFHIVNQHDVTVQTGQCEVLMRRRESSAQGQEPSAERAAS